MFPVDFFFFVLLPLGVAPVLLPLLLTPHQPKERKEIGTVKSFYAIRISWY